jgi:hypothetical protein
MSRNLLFVVLLALGCCLRPLAAQCSTVWTSGGPQPELSGAGRCTTFWDPDGPGPLPLQLVVGGASLVGGSDAGADVMTFDGTAWRALGPLPGTVVSVRKIVNWNGLLVAGGVFFGAGNIAAWNGAAWLPLGPGVPFFVDALTVWNGNLIAAGQMTLGGTHYCDVRSWNGVAWTNLQPPPQLDLPSDAVVYQGQLCLAGARSGAGVSTGLLERWNGSTWAPSIATNLFGSLSCLTVLRSLAVGGTDVLYAGGNFTSLGGTAVSHIASTTGGTAFAWSPVGGGLPHSVFGLHARASGLTNNYTVIAVINSSTQQVQRFTGSTGSWSTMGTEPGSAISYSGGTYYLTSSFASTAASLSWNGTTWVPVRGAGFVGEVRALAARGAQTIVGGVFATVGGTTTNHVAAWDGTTFSPLGSGMTGTSVDALLTLDSGDVVAGGAFTAAGGIAANNLARWNGSAWSPFGSGLNQQVLAICRMPNGDLVVGGAFTTAGGVPCSRIARWNGSTWSPLGSGMNGDVRALAVRGDGVLFAAGTFTTAGGLACTRIAQWNGTGWLPLGAGCNGTVHGLAVRPNGDVVAVGEFSSAGGFAADRCARWIGTGWAPMGAGSSDATALRAVHVLPNGDVLASRAFHQPSTNRDQGISRWNGTTWSSVAGGLEPFQAQPVDVRAFAATPSGGLIVGGEFSAAGGVASRDLAVLSSTCPATAASYGTGCSSAAGPLVVRADTLPWLGASFRTTTTGVAANSVCFGVIGFTQQALPLGSLLPQGQPGCSLLTSTEIVLLLATTGSVARAEFALPNSAILIGTTFRQQTLPLELLQSGALAAVRSSNALAATIGAL